MPRRARTYIGSEVMSLPSSSTRPESGETRPTTIEKVVVLPAPFGPSRPTTSPDEISRLTPRTTVRPLYDLVRSSVRRVAIQNLGGVGAPGPTVTHWRSFTGATLLFSMVVASPSRWNVTLVA